MKNVSSKLLLVFSVVMLSFSSCSEKKGLDKIKEGVSEVSEEIEGGVDEQVEEHEGKKIKIEFGK